MFRNKVKRNMYKFLKKLDKTHDYDVTKNYMLNKISEHNYKIMIKECIDKQLIVNVKYYLSIGCTIEVQELDNIFLTYNGCEFIKNYYSYILKLLRDFLLIIVTAIVTVLINNELSNSNQTVNVCDDVIPQDVSLIKITNNCDN